LFPINNKKSGTLQDTTFTRTCRTAKQTWYRRSGHNRVLQQPNE
jgi:hypothetical protein